MAASSSPVEGFNATRGLPALHAGDPAIRRGMGFAMVEGPLLLSILVRAFRFETVTDRPAMPVAHLTVRGKDGIWLKITPRTVG